MPGRPAFHGTALILLGVIAAVVVIVAAVGWAMSTGPLAGEGRHDFGTLWIDDGTASAEHVFVLRNTGDEPISIAKVVPSCGCTAAEPSTRLVEPGGTVEIKAKLTLSANGLKRTTIRVTGERNGETVGRTLHVRGIGRKRQALSASVEAVPVAAGETTTLTLFADVHESDDAPPAPTVEGPDGLVTEFLGWEMYVRADSGRHTPSRWRGQMHVTPASAPKDGDALVVSIAPDQGIELPLYPAPAHPAAPDVITPEDLRRAREPG